MKNTTTFGRKFWIQKIYQAWCTRPIVWLSGVRRSGKTTLGKMLPKVHYFNCDLPSVQRQLADPEIFLADKKPGMVLMFDEIHQLPNPSMLLKIAADEHPQLKILATGSSTLAATSKFSDSLTGRKHSIHLCPVLWGESIDFLRTDILDERLLRGGLPENLCGSRPKTDFFAEWIDSFYARDILELFQIRNRQGFLNILQLLLRFSGGQIDYSKLATLSEISRPTVKTHIDVMRVAHAVRVLQPFHSGGKREISSRPKCYAFDTGFVAFARGWETIRNEDRGLLWEHLVLDTLSTQYRDIFYWRDKSHNEIDFVIKRGGEAVDAIECKINPDKLDPHAIRVFRKFYPQGSNLLLCPQVKQPYRIQREDLRFTVCSEIPNSKAS